MKTPRSRSRSYVDAVRWVDATLRGHAEKELKRIGFTPKQAQSFAEEADDRAIAELVLGEVRLQAQPSKRRS